MQEHQLSMFHIKVPIYMNTCTFANLVRIWYIFVKDRVRDLLNTIIYIGTLFQYPAGDSDTVLCRIL